MTLSLGVVPTSLGLVSASLWGGPVSMSLGAAGVSVPGGWCRCPCKVVSVSLWGVASEDLGTTPPGTPALIIGETIVPGAISKNEILDLINQTRAAKN